METVITAIVAPNATPSNDAVMFAPELVRAANDVLLQGLQLLFEVGDSTFSRTAGAPFHASIGGHYRHVLEHFRSLIHGLRASEINYDARERNVRLQSEVSYASVATCDTLRALKHYDGRILQRECKVINSVGYGPSEPLEMNSNIGSWPIASATRFITTRLSASSATNSAFLSRLNLAWRPLPSSTALPQRADVSPISIHGEGSVALAFAIVLGAFVSEDGATIMAATLTATATLAALLLVYGSATSAYMRWRG